MFSYSQIFLWPIALCRRQPPDELLPQALRSVKTGSLQPRRYFGRSLIRNGQRVSGRSVTGTPVQPSNASCCSAECVFSRPHKTDEEAGDAIAHIDKLNSQPDVAPDARVSNVDVVPPCRLYATSYLAARNWRATAARPVVLPRFSVMTLSMYSNPSSTGATQSSRRISTRAFGRKRFNAKREGVAKTVANRAKPHYENAPYALPIPKGGT